MKLHIKNERNTQFIPYRFNGNALEVALINNALPKKSGRLEANASTIESSLFTGKVQSRLPQVINCNDEPYLTESSVFPVLVSESRQKFIPIEEALEVTESHTQHLLANFATEVLETQSKLIEGQVHKYQNISILLHSLGSNSYRLEWSSRMTGSSTSLAKVSPIQWTVIRRWAQSRNMNDISQVFDKRKQALYHFLANTDIVKTSDGMVEDAKRKAIELFLDLEGQKQRVIGRIPRQRLQGAIGSKVEIRDNVRGKRVIAYGILMQLIKNDAEVQITKHIDLNTRHVFYKVPSKQVYIT